MAALSRLVQGRSIPDRWTISPLRTLLEAEFAGAWGIDPAAKSANVKVLRSTNLGDDGYLDYTSGALRLFASRDLHAKKLKTGDLLLEASGGGPGKPVGRVALFCDPHDGWVYSASNFFRTLRPGSNVLPEYLAYYLAYAYSQPSIWQLQQQTTGIINLKYGDYLDQGIPVPPLGEQEKIVDIVGAMDESIRSQEQALVKIARTKEAAVAASLNKVIEAGVRKSTVGDEFEVKSGITLGPHRMPSNRPVPYLRVANVRRGSIDLGDVALVEEFPRDRYDYILQVGDILVVEGHANPHEIGRCALVRDLAAGVMFQNHLFRLRSKTLNPKFSEAWLNSLTVREYWLRTCSSSSGLHTINSRQLAAAPFFIPSTEGQHAVVSQIEKYDELINAESGTLKKLNVVRGGLMADLLAGRMPI